ncbi:MAG TPA: DUF5939 domain-containing protein [Planctomycetota bacterium]|nr:DUF5939 domain-containing protein [Planctomycetota bacterium]
MPLNEKLLDERLEALERARTWSPRVVSKVEALIRSGDDRALFRVNPIKFAADRNIAEAEAIDLFLHAAHLGLFEMNWYLLCPVCGMVMESFGTLQSVHAHYRCELCDDTFPTVLDDYVEINFTVAASIRPIVYHQPETLSIEDYYYNYQMSTVARLPAGLPMPAGMPFADLLKVVGKLLAWIEPGASVTKEVDLHPGLLAGCIRSQNASFVFPISESAAAGATPHRLKVTLREGAVEPNGTTIPTGRTELTLTNTGSRRAAVLVVNKPAGVPHFTLIFDPFLSGKRLLTTQAFRELYHGQTVGGTSGLGVRDLTVLFTDLKGSTALYERIGDLKAYALVHQHFDTHGRVIATHHGAIVKTIGDAVMATFANPVDGLQAALEMLDAIERFNSRFTTKEIYLKVGIHRGASIAVTSNDRLDYFGQTVNIASRVQGLADAEEIYVTQEIYSYTGVPELLKSRAVTPGRARLKGVAEEMQVYKIAPARS